MSAVMSLNFGGVPVTANANAVAVDAVTVLVSGMSDKLLTGFAEVEVSVVASSDFFLPQLTVNVSAAVAREMFFRFNFIMTP